MSTHIRIGGKIVLLLERERTKKGGYYKSFQFRSQAFGKKGEINLSWENHTVVILSLNHTPGLIQIRFGQRRSPDSGGDELIALDSLRGVNRANVG